MKHAVLGFAATCLLLTGCANPHVREGIQQFGRRDFEQAAALLERGLTEEQTGGALIPNTRMLARGRILMTVSRRKASEGYAEKAYSHYLLGETKLSGEAIHKSLGFWPENFLSNRLRGQTVVRTTATVTKRQQAQDLAAQKHWDDAIDVLSETLSMAPTFPDITTLYCRCLKASFEHHSGLGKKHFEDGEYTDGVEELKVALTRINDLLNVKGRPRAKDDECACSECCQWYDKCLAYRRAMEFTLQAQKLHKDGAYEAAYDTYQKALDAVKACDPAYTYDPALAGQKATRDEWVAQMLTQAKTLFADANGKKEACHQAHELLGKCEELHSGNRTVAAFWPLVRRRLGEIYTAEAMQLLEVADGSRVATAWLAVQKAESFFAGAKGLGELRASVDALMAAKTRRFVRVEGKGTGDFAKRLATEIARRVPDFQIPGVVIEGSHPGASADKMKETVQKTGACPQLAVLGGTAVVGVTTAQARKQAQNASTPTSRRIAGERLANNTEWTRVSHDYDSNLKRLGGLHSDHSQARSAYESAKVAENEATTLCEARNMASSLVSGLHQSHASRARSWASRDLRCGADCESSNAQRLEATVRQAEQERSRAQEGMSQARRRLSDCDSELHRIKGEIGSATSRAGEQRRFLDFHKPQVPQQVYESYQFKAHKANCTADVRIELTVTMSDRTSTDTVVQLSNKRGASVVCGAAITDAEGIRNCPDPLPDEPTFLGDLQQQATVKCLEHLVGFFRDLHEAQFERAEAARKKGNMLEALERYVLFHYLDRGRSQNRWRQAGEFVDKQVTRPLI